MAVIRCPHCGKPNPDFLDICQYCDTPLHEAAAPAAGQPAAPAGSDADQDLFANLRSASSMPEEEAEAQPVSELPDWLSRLGGPEAAVPGEPPAGSQDKIASWLDNLRNTEPAEEPDSRDWYWTGTQAEAEPASSQPGAAAPSEEMPDWLRSLDTTAPAQGAPAEPEPAGLPDWLQGVSAGTAAQPESPAPAASSPAAAAPAEELPDWLKSVTPAAPAAQPKQPAAPAPAAPASPFAGAEALPDWLQGVTAPPATPAPVSPEPPSPAAPAEEFPEWLQGVGGISTGPAAAPPAAAASPFAASPFAAEPEPEAAPAEDMPDWLRSVGAPASPEPAAGAPASPFAAETPFAPEEPFAAESKVGAVPAAGEELPEWLRSTMAEQPGQAAPALGEVPDWLQSFDAAVPEQPPVAPLAAAAALPPEPEEELPVWLRSIGAGAPASEVAPIEARPTAWLGTPGAAQGGPAIITESPAEEQPEWLRELGVTAPLTSEPPGIPPLEPSGAEQPEWLRGLSPAAPSAAAETMPGTSSPFGAEEAALPEAASTQLPDWLAGLAPAQPAAPRAEAPPAMPTGAHLATAALPSWLEAMRPIEVQRPSITPEVDEYEETVGVLAGLRGVLRAQPGAAQLGKTATKVHKLEVTDAQAKQADVLTRTLAQATETHAAAKGAFWRTLPLARLAIFAILFLAFAMPLTLPAVGLPDVRGYFAPAPNWSQSAQDTFTFLDGLSPAQPALVVFDYDPAQAGELDPLAQAVILHLQRRSVPVVGLSTSPAGAATGDALLRQIIDPAAYGSRYVNLGYLPGGPVGMLQITTGLQPLLPVDFRGEAGVWGSAVLANTRQLSDFGVIVIVSATPDTVRAWVEQLQNYAAKPALVAAVSAGAEPLVRPYYDTDPAHRQLKGLVSGILGAAQYERQSGVAGLASGEMWDVLGWGMLAIIVVLIAGNVFYGLDGAMRRQKR